MKAAFFIFTMFLTFRVLAVEEFILNGFPEAVQQDTVTPANSVPLPVGVLNSSGLQVDLATEPKQDDIISELQSANASLVTIDQVLDDSYLVLQSLDAKDFATETTLSAAAASLVSIDTKLTSPLTVQATDLDIRDLSSASDSVSAVQSGTWDINDISGTVSLPTGASTEAKQDSQITELQDIESDVEAMSAKLPATLGQTTSSGSLSVTMASDQGPITVIIPQYTGVLDASNSISTSQTTFIPPTGAVGFKIQAPSTNTQNIRFNLAAPALPSTGFLMEPGRSEDFDVGGSSITVASVSGTGQGVIILWRVAP